jgi:hypothetical protein
MTTYECSVCKKEIAIRDIIKKVIKDFPEDKQKMIDWECPNADEHYKIIRRREVMALPQEKRQETLDLFKKGNSIGEVCKLQNLSSDVVCEIITMNIQAVSYLREEAL